jgi:hypothetical protein
MKPFDNIDRNRYYGLRIGDIISVEFPSMNSLAEVVDYGGDNNRVYIKLEDGTITDWVAEYCTIITKVEDL